MQKYLTENDTIGEIRQSSRHPIGKMYVWVLVEGITDQKLYTKLLDGENTKVEMAHGGGIKSLRNTMQVLVEENNRVVGIRDADFLHLDQQQESINRLFVTDTHDAEMMLFACDTVFQHLLCEYIPSEYSQFMVVRENLLKSLAFISGIRWLNTLENLRLNFNKLSLDSFYDADSLNLDKTRCIQSIEGRSPKKKRAIQEQEVNDKISKTTDYFNLCNGHDVVKGLALYLTSKTTKGIKSTTLETLLRTAYRKEDFVTTALCGELKAWEKTSGLQLMQK